MKVILMGRKPYSCKALDYLIEKKIEVLAVVAIPESEPVFWSPRLSDTVKKHNIPLVTDDDLYNILEGKENKFKIDLSDVDLVLSYLYWKIIKKPLIDLPKIGCINFHPGPLPELRGLGGYNVAILEGKRYYGVTAHFVNEEIDSGDIIEVKRFDIDPYLETAYSLEQKSQEFMFEQFKNIINLTLEGKPLPRVKQGHGRYITRDDFESMRTLELNEHEFIIRRKIKAFWYPPYHGATITINEKEYTLIDEDILKEIGDLYHNKKL